jgi:signal transduction histidine kinase/CheY-like chemotaxis protein
MAGEAGSRGSARTPAWRLGTLSVGAKLITLCTLLTAAVVAVSFLVLSLSLTRHTERLLAETLSRHQRTLSHLQQDNLKELLRISTVMTDSPTLRAAMETFASESGLTTGGRADLLATIQNEASKVAGHLGRDVLVVTDRNGRVLAAAGKAGTAHRIGEDLSSIPLVRHVLDQDEPIGAGNFAVVSFGDEDLRVGCAPIVLQGFIIGTLTLGDRLDHGFVGQLQQSFGCDVVVASGERIVASTLAGGISADDLRALPSSLPSPADAPWVARIGTEDYVSARLPLGSDGQGHDVDLYLLHSLTRSLAASNRDLAWIVLACGAFAVLAAAVTAGSISRSVLRPLEDFVSFMRSVASSGDHSRRFVGRVACLEVDTLNDAYRHLMESLLAHEARLVRAARDDLERLERLKESEKLAALGRMLSGAAHEINNPLTGVLGNIEMTLRGDSLAPETRERLERVQREGRRVAALVRHLLKTSHRDTGERSVLDLNDVVRDAVEARRHDLTAAGVVVVLDLAPSPVPVHGSELELHQVVLNIVNNAADAMKESARRPRLLVTTAIAPGWATLVIADNGPGMRNPKQVFDHFYTTKPVGQGTGLGLSICYATVQQHGGRITAENSPEGGARFTIELPLETTRAKNEDATGASAGSQAPPEAPLPASILVVDDEPTLVELQKDILEALGAVVVGAASGDEAIEQLQKRPFDLIVTDVKMPGGVSGADLFRWVETHLPGSACGFVFVTGDNAGDGSRSFVASVGARCVMKPFSMEEYVQTLRETYGETRRSS